MDFSAEGLKARWNELTPQVADLDDQRNVCYVELNSIVDGTFAGTLPEARARETELRASIKGLNEQIFPLDMERANIARALGGRTG